MYSVKVNNDDKLFDSEFDQTIKDIINYIVSQTGEKNTKIVSDRNGIEVVSGKEESSNGEQIMVELVIRKNVLINNSDLNDKAKLDKHLTKIKHFCEQAKSIEELKQLH